MCYSLKNHSDNHFNLFLSGFEVKELGEGQETSKEGGREGMQEVGGGYEEDDEVQLQVGFISWFIVVSF